MQAVAQSWLVLQLTGSGVDLGITVGLQFGPVLVLGAWAGALADRVDKRRLLMATQTAAALFALVLAALTFTDVVTVWMIWVLAGLTGVATALDLPSRQSFVYEMVGPDDLANAVGLNAVIINSSRIVGPAIGGLLIAAVGVAPCFLFNAVSFVAVIVALAVMRTARAAPQQAGASPARPGARGPALRVAHAGAAHPAGDAGRGEHAGLQLLGRAAAAHQGRVRPRRRRLRRSLRGHGRGRARRRPAHGQPGAPLAPPARGQHLRLRRGHGAARRRRPATSGAWRSSCPWAPPACSSSAPSTRCCSSTPTTPCAAA